MRVCLQAGVGEQACVCVCVYFIIIVEVGEGCWARAELPQPSKEGKALVSFLGDSFDVAVPRQIAGDIYSEEFEAFNHLAFVYTIKVCTCIFVCACVHWCECVRWCECVCWCM